jgi:F-type H+-transporting ATPase subunit delta
MAEKKRLSIVPYLITELSKLISQEKGELTAEIISATKLTLEQNKKLVEILSSFTGKIVKLDSMTDKQIIGGLIVKVGSRMLDTSIRAKLLSLQTTMKEVG